MKPNVTFLWGRQRSGTNWLIRLILKNFKHSMVVVAWKHFEPSTMPGAIRLPLMERRPPDAVETETIIQQLYDIPGGPARVFITDDLGLPHPDNCSVHPEIRKAVIESVVDHSMNHVAIVKHPENWLASIRVWPEEWGWNLSHWESAAEWALTLRSSEYKGILLRWEDLRDNLNHLAPIEELPGMERTSPEWLAETKIVGSHGTPPPPDAEAFRSRKPAVIPFEERGLVKDATMAALGYEWGKP